MRASLSNAQVAPGARPARLVPLDGDDHPFWAGDTSVLLDELEAFVRGLGP
jgi:hypothetical protein